MIEDLGQLQRHVPGLVSGLHLVGSIALGDFHPGRSDLDFVAVLDHPATDDEIEALIIQHRLYASDPTLPPLDGIWVTEAELAAGPDAAAAGPTTLANQLLGRARGNRNPVTWFMLADTSVTVRGARDRSRLWRDPARLASWTGENVESYWVPWHARASKLLSGPGLAMLGSRAPAWGALGISRLYYTLATGRITSKGGAGEHALAAFEPRWHRIVSECLRIHRGKPGGLYNNPLHRRRDALDFIEMVIGAIRGA